MIITGKHVSRRALLRGVGAAVALPMLDAMVPALKASGNDRRQIVAEPDDVRLRSEWN